jgi:hypothetical protein
MGATITPATAELKAFEAKVLRLAQAPQVKAAQEQARQLFLANPYAKEPEGAKTLEDAAHQHLFSALQIVANSDPHHPEISMVFMYEHEVDGQVSPSSLHGGLENPDNVYRIIPITSECRYELHGTRFSPAPAQVTYELMDAIPGLGGIGEQLGLLMDRDMALGADGSFVITLDSDPANGRKNHIQTNDKARALFIRDTLSDWNTQRADKLKIIKTAGPAKAALSEDEMVALAAKLVPEYSKFWCDFPGMMREKLKFKTNAFDPPAKRTGGWGFIANTHFLIKDDEAFVFTAATENAPYHAVLIGNHWWIVPDCDHHSAAFNTSQSKVNADGTITYVIATRDPGVWNWIDTGGIHEGIIQVRWQGTGAEVTELPTAIRDAAVVKLADLKATLRPETAWVDAAARKAQLTDRHVSYVKRLSLP